VLIYPSPSITISILTSSIYEIMTLLEHKDKIL
jgi:hypothetical protein